MSALFVMLRPARVFFATLLVVCWRTAAFAHPAPFSYLDLHLDDGRVSGTLVVHIIDIAHDLGIEPPEALFVSARAEAERERIGALIAPRLALRLGRERVPLRWRRVEVLSDRQAVKLAFDCGSASGGVVDVSGPLFPYDPNHTTFINVYEAGTLAAQAVLDGGHRRYDYFAGTRQGVLAVIRAFVPSGIHHIVIGPDHILFLVGLLLLGGTLWQLLKIVTAFTIAHSVTLSLAALGLLRPPAQIIEPAIALSIVYVGADNLLVTKNGRDARAWIAFAFGLVHGFGFANVLREIGLPPRALGWSLFSFNLGVEIGQVVIVTIVAALLVAVRRRSEPLGRLVVVAGSVAVMAAGAYWFVERVFLTGGV